jgi:hypothetical protein
VKEERHGRDSLLILVGVLWVGLIISGFWLLTREHFTPVASIRQATTFPSTPRSTSQRATARGCFLLLQSIFEVFARDSTRISDQCPRGVNLVPDVPKQHVTPATIPEVVFVALHLSPLVF